MVGKKTLELPIGDPAEMGFMPERINKIGSLIDNEVSSGRLPGAATIIARQG